MLEEFKVLHANIGKRKTAHWSLFCDESLAGFDALPVVEPYIYEDLDTGEPALPVERNWQLFKPSTRHEGEARYAYRASVWVNKRHAAQQTALPSGDMVAVTVSHQSRRSVHCVRVRCEVDRWSSSDRRAAPIQVADHQRSVR